MPARMVIELSDGRKVLFGNRPLGGQDLPEGPPPDGGGLGQIGVANRITTATADQLRRSIGTLSELIGTLEQSIGRMVSRPDKIELELRASLSGECDLWIVSGEGEAEFKVTVAWGKTD